MQTIDNVKNANAFKPPVSKLFDKSLDNWIMNYTHLGWLVIEVEYLYSANSKV